MTTEGRNYEIVPYRLHASELGVKFEVPSETTLSLKHLRGIGNAWFRGAKVDRYGRIWICQSELHNVLRTTKENARYFLLKIEEKYQTKLDGKIHIQGSAVSHLLDELIQSAGSFRTAQYARYSEEIYRIIRDSDKAELIRTDYYEVIKECKRKLKRTRITQLKLEHDELTGFPLDKRNSEFSHIRDSKIYLHLADKYWNGLVVNKDIHQIITQRGIKDEEQLLDFCKEEGWKKGWYPDFSKSLASYE